MNKIKQTNIEKVNGKFVKYRQGDCLSFKCPNGVYLGGIVSEKFNKYYDITLIEFYKKNMPALSDFINGRFFGTRFGSWENLRYWVDKQMISCKYIDNNNDVEKVGNIKLIPNLGKAGYAYLENIDELIEFYLNDIPIRIEKTQNAEKFPDLAFVNKHLIETKNIIQQEPFYSILLRAINGFLPWKMIAVIIMVSSLK